MKKYFLFILLLLVFIITPFLGDCSTEVTYPTLPGVVSPQDIVKEVEREEDVLPLFITYIFNLLLIVSAVVAVVVIIYGGFLFITASDDPEKKQNAKKWILSAFQGAIIVLLSYTILFTLDSRLVLFRQIDLEEQTDIDSVGLEWEVRNIYFQIPLGLILEDAILNDIGKSKINDVFTATQKTEQSADNIKKASIELMEIIERCPVGEKCCDGEEGEGTPYEKVTDRVAEEGCFPVDASGRPRYTSFFGPRNLLGNTFHYGTDIGAPTGTPVRATHEGKVVFAGSRGGRGNTVIVEHIINGGRYNIFYTHLNSISVNNGDVVTPGSGIGTIGSTGRSTGPHLHYEVRNPSGSAIDPIAGGFLPKSIGNYCSIPSAIFSQQQKKLTISSLFSNNKNIYLSSLFGRDVFASSSTSCKHNWEYQRFDLWCPSEWEYESDGTCCSWSTGLRIPGALCCKRPFSDPDPDKNETCTTSNYYERFKSAGMDCYKVEPPGWSAARSSCCFGRAGISTRCCKISKNMVDIDCAVVGIDKDSNTRIEDCKVKSSCSTGEKDKSTQALINSQLQGQIRCCCSPVEEGVDEKCKDVDGYPKEHSDIKKDKCEEAQGCKWNDKNNTCCCKDDYDPTDPGEKAEVCYDYGAEYDPYEEKPSPDEDYVCHEEKDDEGKTFYCCTAKENIDPDEGCSDQFPNESDQQMCVDHPEDCSLVGDDENALCCCNDKMKNDDDDDDDNGNGTDEGCTQDFPNESDQQMCVDHPEDCNLTGEDANTVCCCNNNIDIIEPGCNEEFPKNQDMQLCEDGVDGCEKTDDGDGNFICCCKEDVLDPGSKDYICNENLDGDDWISQEEIGACVDSPPEGYFCEWYEDKTEGPICCCRPLKEGDPCNDDSNCGDGLICVNGVCVDGRCPDGKCPTGYKCVNGFCYKTCSLNSDCPEGYVCEDGICQKKCKEDKDCLDNMVCNTENGICVECIEDTDCLDNLVCVDNICKEKPNCPACPKINHLILAKISELEGYMDTLNQDIILLLSTKEPLKEDLYNLYKVVMLKSLGYQKVINYIDFLTERLYYETMEVGLVTDNEEVNIGSYSWGWSKWLFNILYGIEAEERTITENDPATFFLKKPMADDIIKDALNLAQSAKQNDIQSLGREAIDNVNESNQSLIHKIVSFAKEVFIKAQKVITQTREVMAQTEAEKIKSCLEEEVGSSIFSPSECMKTISDCMEKNNISETEINLTEEEREEIFSKCNIEEGVYDGHLIADYLSCGMEIPIGEAVETTWHHLMKILYAVDEYEVKAKELIEKQDYMNELSRPCECICEGEGDCIQEISPSISKSTDAPAPGTENCEKHLGNGWYEVDNDICIRISARTPGFECAHIVDNRGQRIYDADGKIVCGKGEPIRPEIPSQIQTGNVRDTADSVALCCSRDCTDKDFANQKKCVPNTSLLPQRQVLSSLSFDEKECGECELTCDKNAIRTTHKEVLQIREELQVLAENIYILTNGFYNEATEDVCHYLNEDIRSEKEREDCTKNQKTLITKYELITRKLNYSRTEFDKCLIRPEDIEGVLTGKSSGKTLFFGPVAEEYNLPRYTKTKESGEMKNTSNFNWFCCTD